MGLRIRIRIRAPRIHLPKIELPKIPNPIDVATDVLKTTAKAIDDVAHLPKKVVAELERDLNRISNGLSDARKKVTREVGGALHLLTDAAKAAEKFAEREARSPLDAVKGVLHRRNFVSSMWYLATSPIKATNKNAMQATCDSALLAVAAQVAATAYGGPAGAAAYAAWTTYNVTGGDINAALRAGVMTGVTAAATGAVASMPAGAGKIAAEAGLKIAIARAQGQSTEEAAQTALAALVQVASAQLSTSVNQAQLDKFQKGIVSGALGGATVAATGGNGEAVREAFLKNGGAVLIQGVRDEISDIAEAAERSSIQFLATALDEEDLESAGRKLVEIKDQVQNAEAAVAEAKQSLKAVLTTYQEAGKESAAEIMKARASIQSQVDSSRARVIQAREEMESQSRAVQEAATKAFGTLNLECQKEMAIGKRSSDEIKAAADAKIREIQDLSDKASAEFDRQLAEVVAKEDKISSEGLRLLEETRAGAMDELLRIGGSSNSHALSKDWVLSWDTNQIASAKGGIAVVLTFAGPGSEIDGQVDTIENPIEP